MTVVARASSASATSTRRSSLAPEKKYKCQFCHTAFSRSEHRSRHERSHTKERPFKCVKCRSTFVRRDLLLRHDRTVHAKDGGLPLHGEGRRRGVAAKSSPTPTPAPSAKNSRPTGLDPLTLEQIEVSSDGVVDLETAAMLMTDLHHKATAAAADVAHQMMHHQHHRGLDVIDPTVTETAVGLAVDPAMALAPVPGSGSLGLPPPMPWDAFLSAAAAATSSAEPTAHSIASSVVSGSQDSHASQHPSLTSVSTAQAPPDPPSPVISRHHGAMATTTLGPDQTTPGPYSPHPWMAAAAAPPPPLSPTLSARADSSSRSPTPIGHPSARRPPQFVTEADRHRLEERIRAEDPENALADAFRLPSRPRLNRYLSTYFGLFHHHLPFLHPASFRPAEASPALLLAVLSIGALYAFDHGPAYMLHIGSKVLVSQFLQNKENFSSRKCPLWTMQSSLLNMIFASWSGDPKGLEWACSIKGLLANMVAGNRYELKLRIEARDGAAPPTYTEWIEDEGCRRTYFAVYIFFGLLTMTYNHTPAISFNEIDSLDLPSTESMWSLELDDEEAWRDQARDATVISFREAHDKLFQGEPARYSALATRVMINALFLEVWYHQRSPEALQDVVTEYKLRRALETWEQALDLCEPDSVVVPVRAPFDGHPLVFNAMAMFRHTRARLEVDLRAVQEALRYHDPYEVAAAMTLARDQVKRSDIMTAVIRECLECVEIAASQGIRWVARTSATNWSVEHALCGVDLMVILSLWLWRVEHDDDEPASDEEWTLYHRVRQLFEDESDLTDGGGGMKLSGTVARVWGGMLDEVVVWGITRLLGESFKLHSQALVGYEDALATASAMSTPSGDATMGAMAPRHPSLPGVALATVSSPSAPYQAIAVPDGAGY